MNTLGTGTGDNSLPPPPLEELYTWCINQAPDRPGRQETCSKYVKYLEKMQWPLRLAKLQTMKLNSWQIMSIRSYLRFLEERGIDVTRWKKLSVLRKKKKGTRKIIVKDEEVEYALKTLNTNRLKQYHLIYIIMLYTGLRLEHTVRLLTEWNTLSASYHKITGECIRIPLPWVSGPKRSFYAYMPQWLYDKIHETSIDRRNVSNIARRKKIIPPSFIRKYALHNMAKLLGPQITAHIAGHKQGSELFPALINDKILEQHYISIEDIAAQQYHRYANHITNKFAKVIT